ncbi:retrovirus-related pol polyprotein from transposon TNT 1-94 [Tanacetum coccineum]
MTNATTIAPGMYKLDLVILALKLIQELLGYVKDTCLDIHKPGVKPSTSASGSKPLGNTKNDRISRTPSSNEKNKHPVKGAQALCFVYNECLFDANHAMCLIDHVNSMNVVQIALWYLDSSCSKHMTRDSSQLTNFVHKFLDTVKFAARTMLIYAKAPLFLWAEAVATARYTQNQSIIRRHHGKTPYELLHDRKPDLSYLHVFGALCYPNNDSENLGKLQAKVDIGIFIGYAPKKKAYHIYNRRTQKIIETIHVDFDELTAMASEQSSLEPVLHEMTPSTPSSGLIPNLTPSAPFVPPSRHEWDLVFQPVFDEFFSPPASVSSPILVEEAPAPVESTGSPSSTTINQDAPSPKESHDLEVAHMSNDPYFGIPIPETVSEESSSSDIIPTIVHSDAPISEHLNKVMVITLKWIYKVKLDELGGILKNKARLVARGYHPDNPNHVYRLKKALYGLKQAPRAIEFLIDKLGMRSFTPETLKDLEDEAEE